jgi:hypothetical protein
MKTELSLRSESIVTYINLISAYKNNTCLVPRFDPKLEFEFEYKHPTIAKALEDQKIELYIKTLHNILSPYIDSNPETKVDFAILFIGIEMAIQWFDAQTYKDVDAQTFENVRAQMVKLQMMLLPCLKNEISWEEIKPIWETLL